MDWLPPIEVSRISDGGKVRPHKELFLIQSDYSERYGLTQQLRKAAVSIPSNISEGYGRRSAKEYVRFLEFALGSRNESYTQVILANRLGFLSDEKFMNLENELLIECVNERKIDGVIWWYEAWDGTWQRYSVKFSSDIEQQYKTRVSPVR